MASVCRVAGTLANAIYTEDRKWSMFLSVIGPIPNKLLRNLVDTDMRVDKPFATLVEVMEKHNSPKLSANIQRFRFHS